MRENTVARNVGKGSTPLTTRRDKIQHDWKPYYLAKMRAALEVFIAEQTNQEEIK